MFNHGTVRRYFAYGSNMDEGQMKERCPQSTKIKNASVAGFEFFINKRSVASIRKKEGKNVWGIVYSITKSDEARLDVKEGYNKDPKDYNKKDLPELNAFCYIDPIEENGSPRNSYIEKIINAATVNRFPKEYIVELESWLK